MSFLFFFSFTLNKQCQYTTREITRKLRNWKKSMSWTNLFGFEVNDSRQRETGAIAKCHPQKGQPTRGNILTCPGPGSIPLNVLVAAFYDFMLWVLGRYLQLYAQTGVALLSAPTSLTTLFQRCWLLTAPLTWDTYRTAIIPLPFLPAHGCLSSWCSMSLPVNWLSTAQQA